MNKISPSVMCFDMLNLGQQIRQLDEAGVDLYHVDVMDGHYVPNHALCSDTVRLIRKISKTPIDVHLMVTNPMDFIDSYADAGADYIVMHIETLIHPVRALKKVRARGLKAGLAINPATSVEPLKYMLDFIDMICVMSVDPGFAGQTLIPSAYGKISEIRAMFDAKNVDIIVDGQVKNETAAAMVKAGANCLVVGSSGLFCYPPEQYAQVIKTYQNLER